MEVTLAQMLEAREARAFRQFQLSQEYGKPMVSFSMNIPGPVKNSPLIRMGFHTGCEMLEKELLSIVHREIIEAVTGCEAIFVADMSPLALKAITTRIEDTHPLGRLFDMDVLDEKQKKLNRNLVDGGDRNCIVCGAPGRGCASRRIHSVEELQKAVYTILLSHFVAKTAVDSLLEEVHTTPKPGLVDENNNGSHMDMDIQLFTVSAHVLEPYFRKCVSAGMESSCLAPRDTFAMLRRLGIQAEKDMYSATGGVNTHKGAIFTMGVLCGAVGRLWMRWSEQDIFAEAAFMVKEDMEKDFRNMTGSTSGERLYAARGIRGIRGELADGLPSVSKIGLPAFRKYLKDGLSRNMAGALTLLHLIGHVEDTCLIHRGGLQASEEAVCRTVELLNSGATIQQIEKLDCWFIQRNLSPGGCADLLAVTYFFAALHDQFGMFFHKRIY